MGYTISTLEELCKLGYEVHVIHWDKNKKSAYQINTKHNIHFYKRSEFNYKKIRALVNEIKPCLTYLSGWMDFDYLKVAYYLRKNNNKVVCGLDTQWRDTFKQKIASLLSSKILLKKFFSNAWIPGYYQFEYAKKLGFKNHEIIYDLYSANENQFFLSKEVKHYSAQKTLLFVGRIEKVKGIDILLKAWLSIKKKNNWKLKIIGDGSLVNLIPKENISIEHIRFLEPSKLCIEMNRSHAFILPSLFDPFPLVIHEACLCGLPIISTNRVGSTNSFLINNFNGFVVNVENNPLSNLVFALHKLLNLSQNELINLSKRSKELSKRITPQTSSYNLISIIDN